MIGYETDPTYQLDHGKSGRKPERPVIYPRGQRIAMAIGAGFKVSKEDLEWYRETFPGAYKLLKL